MKVGYLIKSKYQANWYIRHGLYEKAFHETPFNARVYLGYLDYNGAE